MPSNAQIKWAMNAWSRVTQKRVARKKVLEYVSWYGWERLEAELRYWVEQSKCPDKRKPAPHPDAIPTSMRDTGGDPVSQRRSKLQADRRVSQTNTINRPALGQTRWLQKSKRELHKRMTRQIIYWHHQSDGRKGPKPKRGQKATATIHMLVGYTGNRICDFMELALTMKKTFKSLKTDDVVCTSVSRSSYCERHTVAVWTGEITYKKYRGWHVGDFNNTGYDLAT